MKKNIEFEAIDQSFLTISRQWLNDTEFQDLIMAVPVEESDQLEWYNRLPNRNDYLIWGVKATDQWIGACGLKHINSEEKVAEYWGYIYPDHYRGVGIGWDMFQKCRDHGRKICLETLYLVVAKRNIHAHKAYQRWGFADVAGGPPQAFRMEIKI